MLDSIDNIIHVSLAGELEKAIYMIFPRGLLVAAQRSVVMRASRDLITPRD
jgi:hypothetical protein